MGGVEHVDRRAVLASFKYAGRPDGPSAYGLGVLKSVVCGTPRIQHHWYLAGLVDPPELPLVQGACP